MLYECHFKDRCGFFLVKEITFPKGAPLHHFRMRRYPKLGSCLAMEGDLKYNVNTEDIEFRLEGTIKAHGKHIAYYEEV